MKSKFSTFLFFNKKVSGFELYNFQSTKEGKTFKELKEEAGSIGISFYQQGPS